MLKPEPRKRGHFANTRTYKYFCGHLVSEIAQSLPAEEVSCWKDGQSLTLQVCAVRKFMKETSYCKRCPLFQEDAYHKTLCDIIENWEKDEMENTYGS